MRGLFRTFIFTWMTINTAACLPSWASINAFFNTPHSAKDYSLLQRGIRYLDGALPGSDVHIALYKMNEDSFIDALVRAHNRGVHIKIVLDRSALDRGYRRATRRLRDELPRDSVTICEASGCIGKDNSHNKFLLFSRVKADADAAVISENLVIQTSHNFANHQNYNFNDMVVFSENQNLYDHYLRYWRDLKRQVKIRDYLHSENGTYIDRNSGDSRASVFFMPSPNFDPVAELFSRVDCSRGGTIRVAQSYWKGQRGESLLNRLLELSKEGCTVEAVLRRNSDENEFKKEFRESDIESFAFPSSGRVDVHSKLFLISARVRNSENAPTSRPAQFLLTGSLNQKDDSLQKNDETLLIIENATLFEAYNRYWETMRSNCEDL